MPRLKKNPSGRLSALFGLALAGSVLAASVGVAPQATAAKPDPAASSSTAAGYTGCARPILDKATRGSVLKRSDRVAFEKAARRNNISATQLSKRSRGDDSFWIDRCGKQQFVEPGISGRPAREARRVARASASTPAAPVNQTFALESLPGANLTIYLDFLGETVSGTAWNEQFNANAPIVAEPYSTDQFVDTNFSADELAQIQAVWNVVAEDYAPFNVNVTTKDPGVAAIERSDANDTRYGMRVIATNSGPIFNQCHCGGVAFLNTFNAAPGAERSYYANAWVFGAGTQGVGKYMGDAAAHEVGHTLGLLHDGIKSQAAYSSGTTPWGPIMGAPYGVPVTQWSKGEYNAADQTQDDLSILAAGLTLRTDDHGDDTSHATAASQDVRIPGVIATATDKDVFSFTASGPTTVRVDTAAAADLDAQLTILDANGGPVATVNPAVEQVSAEYANGLDAKYTADLGPNTGLFYAIVEGVGSGDPKSAGKYSDYGSIGAYSFKVGPTPDGEPVPISMTAPAVMKMTAGTAIQPFQGATASGGTAPYSWSASGLPSGVTIDPTTGVISGTPSDPGSYKATIGVTDADNQIASIGLDITVETSVPGGVVVNDFTASLFRGKSSVIKIKTAGGGSKKTYSASGLPAWASLSAAGVIKGTPTENGTFPVTLTVSSTHKDGVTVSTDTARLTIIVAEQQVKFSFDKVTIKGGQVGVPYTGSVSIKGGYPSYKWQVSTQTVPYGVTASLTDPYTMTFKGTPTTAGKFGFYVLVTDGTGTQIVKNLTVVIKAAA